MSPVIAFDIAVVAQKVSPVLRTGMYLKKWGGGAAAGSVVGWDGY